MISNRRATPRDGVGDALLRLGEVNRQVVVLTADVAESTRVAAFASAFPERFFDVGVAEQNMLGIAAGLANEGFIPFCAAYAVFSPGRNWDQLRVSICYNESNVKIIGSHAGLATGPDGATHQALEDIAITRVLPNMVVLAPADINQARAAVLAAAAYTGPVYIRVSRGDELVLTKEDDEFVIGQAKRWQKGRDVTLAVTGSMLGAAIAAAERAEAKGISVDLIHFPTIKPLDEKKLIDSARVTRAVVTVEDHQRCGGFGSAVTEALTQKVPTLVWRVGVDDKFGASGQENELYKEYKLDENDIVAAIMAAAIKKR